MAGHTSDDDSGGGEEGGDDDINATEGSSVGADHDFYLEKSECPPSAECRLVHSGSGLRAECNDLGHGGVGAIEGKYNDDDDESIGGLLSVTHGAAPATTAGKGDAGPKTRVQPTGNTDRPPLGSSSNTTNKPIHNHMHPALIAPKNNQNNQHPHDAGESVTSDQTDNPTITTSDSIVTTTSQTSKLTLGILAQISGLVDFDDDEENPQQYGTTYPSEDDEDDVVDEVERAAQINRGSKDSMSIPMDNHASHDLFVSGGKVGGGERLQVTEDDDRFDGDFGVSSPKAVDVSGSSSTVFSPFNANLSAIHNQSTHHMMDDSPAKDGYEDGVAPTSLTDAFDDADCVGKIMNKVQQGGDEDCTGWKPQPEMNHEKLTNYIQETKTTNYIQETKSEMTVLISMSSSSDNNSDIVKDDGGSDIQEQHHVDPAVEEEKEFCVSNIKNRWKQREEGLIRSSPQPTTKVDTNKKGNSRNTDQLIEVEWPSHGPLSPAKSNGAEKQKEINFNDNSFVDSDEESHDKWNPRSIGSGKLVEQSLSFHDMNSSFGGSSTGNYTGDGFLSAASGFVKSKKEKESTTPPPPFWRSHPRKSNISSIESKVRQKSAKLDVRQTQTTVIDVIDELPTNIHFPQSQEETKNCTPKLTGSHKELYHDSQWPVNTIGNEDIPNKFTVSSQVSPRTYSFKKDICKVTSTAPSNIQDEVRRPRSFIKENYPIPSVPTSSLHNSFRSLDLNEESRSSVHSYGSMQSSKKIKSKEIIQNMPAIVTPEVSIRKEFEEDARSGYSRPSSINDRINSLRGLMKNDTEEDTRSTASKSSRASSFASRIAAFEPRPVSGVVSPCLPRPHLTSATPNRRPPLSNAALQDTSKEGGLW